MRIRLERKLKTCPSQLLCTVCRQKFEVQKIRTLLFNDAGLLQGDICSECRELRSSTIRERMREQACLLMEYPELNCSSLLSGKERALELLEASQEEVRFPTFYHWWLKKIEVFSEESQELEATRLGSSDHLSGVRFQKMIEDDKE